MPAPKKGTNPFADKGKVCPKCKMPKCKCK